MTKLVARSKSKRLRVSVIVPCSHKHAKHLPELLPQIAKQTRKPDEIIVALSGCGPPDPMAGVRFVHSKVARSAGYNRNAASEGATGDVLIYQDADDLPHPQRVEVIAALFEKYEIEHLMHSFIYTRGSTWYIAGDSKRFPFPIVMPPTTIDEAASKSSYRTHPAGNMTNGEVSILRSVWSAVKWPDHMGTAEDVGFNQKIFKQFKQTVTTPLPLIVYRHHLSSFG